MPQLEVVNGVHGISQRVLDTPSWDGSWGCHSTPTPEHRYFPCIPVKIEVKNTPALNTCQTNRRIPNEISGGRCAA
jgi:hypothetical protein